MQLEEPWEFEEEVECLEVELRLVDIITWVEVD